MEADMSGSHEVLIVGGGAAGIAVAASLQARLPGIDIAIVEPATTHFYQPGWTMVGAGIFKAGDTAHDMASVMPRGVRWIKVAAAEFAPERNAVVLAEALLHKSIERVVPQTPDGFTAWSPLRSWACPSA
jgi:sulfide:quinone oxidoreductase